MRQFSSQNGLTVAAGTFTWSETTPSGRPAARDGSWGFTIGGADYIAFGWTGGNDSLQDFYKSTDAGATYTRQADLPFQKRHTAATYNLDSTAYVVGGDVFYPGTDSWVYNGSTWSQRASNCGIGVRSLMGAAYLNGAFYIVGGQVDRLISAGKYDNVLRSTDNCATFTQIATTPFVCGNLWGACAAFKGRIWKVCGGIYDDGNIGNRTYPKEIYSSADGITWVYEGIFPGSGRQYHQTIVFDDKLWVIGGFYNIGATTDNLGDTWYSANGVDWTQLTGSAITDLHALTAWVGSDNKIHTSGGSTDPGTVITNKYHKLTKV
jgi:N-acetylneuraminic acid mutarotase